MSHLGLRSLWMELWKSVIQADSRMHNVLYMLYMCLDTYIWIQRRKIGMRTFFLCVWSIICQKLGYPIFRPLSSWFPCRCFSYVFSGPLPRSPTIATAWWNPCGEGDTRQDLQECRPLGLPLPLLKQEQLPGRSGMSRLGLGCQKIWQKTSQGFIMIEKRDGNSPKTWDYPSVIVMICNDL